MTKWFVFRHLKLSLLDAVSNLTALDIFVVDDFPSLCVIAHAHAKKGRLPESKHFDLLSITVELPAGGRVVPQIPLRDEVLSLSIGAMADDDSVGVVEHDQLVDLATRNSDELEKRTLLRKVFHCELLTS